MTLEQKIVVGFWACSAIIVVCTIASSLAELFGWKTVGGIAFILLIKVLFVGMVIFSFWAFLH